MDLDFFESDEQEWSQFLPYIRHLQKLVKDSYPLLTSEQQRCFVCVSSERTKSKSGVKHGIHLIWPNILVNKDVALKLRHFVFLPELEKKFERPMNNSWSQAFDVCVY